MINPTRQDFTKTNNKMEARNVKVGIPVILWSVIRKSRGFNPVETYIASEPFKRNGKVVCKVGDNKVVPVKNLQPIVEA